MMKKKYLVTLVLLAIVLVLFASSYFRLRGRTKLDYKNSLNQTAVIVEGEALNLSQLAFYVAYEENQVEEQAIVYDSKNPTKYWNVYTNHTYIRNAARNAAMQMAIHDTYFYHMALREDIALNEEERQMLKQKIDDFWMDLVDYDKEEYLGVSREDIANTMTRIAYAQKMQQIYALLNNQENSQYEFAGEAYKQMLSQISYEIDKNVWERVDFGNVTYKR